VIPVYPAVRALLVNDPAVSSLVGTRVYPDILPQKPTVPAMVLQAWFVRDAATTAGASGFELHRVQLDAYAETREAADALMSAAANALDPRAPHSGTFVWDSVRITARQDTGAGRPTYDGQDTKLYRRSMDFKVQAARAA
jgi:hypothetical protein